jgi:hypothetical protein
VLVVSPRRACCRDVKYTYAVCTPYSIYAYIYAVYGLEALLGAYIYGDMIYGATPDSGQ